LEYPLGKGSVYLGLQFGGIVHIYPGPYGGALVLSPDLKTLYAGDADSSPATLYSFDVSADPPVALQQSPFDLFAGDVGDFKLSHDGAFLCAPSSAKAGISKLASSDIRSTVAEYLLPDQSDEYPPSVGLAVAISPDGKTIFTTASYFPTVQVPCSATTIDLFDVRTKKLLRKFSTGPFLPLHFAIDAAGQFLFAAPYRGPVAQLRVYSTGHEVTPAHPAEAQKLAECFNALGGETGR
jgi:WD40 repeat protein